MSESPSLDHDPLSSIARRTGFTEAAVAAMRDALVRGGGRMAQFDHPEFGGPGQWMHGGMLMIADFANDDLRRRVDRLCDELSASIAREPTGAAPPRPGSPSVVRDRGWYPASLGAPDSSGAQNDVRYAWFGDARRLAIDDGRAVTIYDTGDHRIGGVSQQQGARRTVSFVSQHGIVDVDRLPVVEADAVAPAAPASPSAQTGDASDPFVAIERLAALHARGIVDDAEFAAKKAELLERI